MFQRVFILGIAFCLWPYIANAQSADRVTQAVFVMQSACLARSELKIEAKGEGGILLLKKGAKVEGEYKETEIPSLLSKLQSEVGLMSEANQVRACMSPHIDKILDAIFQNPPKSK